jgi:SAM-dependent methyltransferase
VTDALRPTADEALQAWAARVRANREQVEQFREATPRDFYAPIAGMFRADPRRSDDPALTALLSLVEPSDTVLDIGAGGGRYALPLALDCREVIAVDPSETMRRLLNEAMSEHDIRNIRVIDGRWPECAGVQGDVALISHLGYDVEAIGPFLDAMDASARRLCVAILLSQPPPTEADRFWPLVHGVERAALPSLPEFLTLLTARGRLFEVRLVERSPQTYVSPEHAFAFLRQQLWTSEGSARDQALERLARERLTQRDGRYALNWAPVPMGIVTWTP